MGGNYLSSEGLRSSGNEAPQSHGLRVLPMTQPLPTFLPNSGSKGKPSAGWKVVPGSQCTPELEGLLPSPASLVLRSTDSKYTHTQHSPCTPMLTPTHVHSPHIHTLSLLHTVTLSFALAPTHFHTLSCSHIVIYSHASHGHTLAHMVTRSHPDALTHPSHSHPITVMAPPEQAAILGP